MSKGLTLKLYQVARSLSVLISADIMACSGHVITEHLACLPYLLRQLETQRTGVYFQVGPNK
ncbi:hypothetical protein ACRPM7_27460 [Burkholderia vietnamiensis]|uniref:hypothetical protein n=1 Tax=Burkholderia vietnamiensis TaxID=60552 RepID=UPI001B98AA06|nr:hypothetical protein [Burkholderia vietnamiensis]MBR8194184.1 hypothetical protein [Burkholderia vietnamiensis]